MAAGRVRRVVHSFFPIREPPSLTLSPAYREEGEGDPLRQRQLVREVDRVRRPPHVVLPGVRAALPAAAGMLFAAERAADLGAAGADVDVGDAAVAARRR